MYLVVPQACRGDAVHEQPVIYDVNTLLGKYYNVQKLGMSLRQHNIFTNVLESLGLGIEITK